MYNIKKIENKTLDIKDIFGMDYDQEQGVLWLEDENNDNIFMVCLDFQHTHSDGADLVIIWPSLGYQVVDLNDCGERNGMCGDHNEALYGSSMHDNFQNAFDVFKKYMLDNYKSDYKIYLRSDAEGAKE